MRSIVLTLAMTCGTFFVSPDVAEATNYGHVKNRVVVSNFGHVRSFNKFNSFNRGGVVVVDRFGRRVIVNNGLYSRSVILNNGYSNRVFSRGYGSNGAVFVAPFSYGSVFSRGCY